MIGLNRKEKEQLIVDLYNNGSSYHEIAKKLGYHFVTLKVFWIKQMEYNPCPNLLRHIECFLKANLLPM